MNKLDIKKVAQAVTEQPTELIISREVSGAWDKLLVKLKIRKLERSFIVKPPTLGMALRITELFQDITIPEKPENRVNDWSNDFISSNALKMAKIVAVYVHGKKSNPPNSLVAFLMDNVTFTELEEITELIKSYVDVVPFINSISLIRSLDLISPGLEKESLQNTGEIIAPGDLSEAQQSISDLA